jgi:drug/metabolite transporter (DMT)-like permease
MWPKLRLGLALGHRQILGMALVIGASLSWATGSILSKRWHIRVDAYAASGWEMFLAGLVNLIIAAVFGDLTRTHWDRDAVLAIGYLVIAGSWVGFTAYLWLLRNVPTSKVATYAYVNPIVAVFLGWVFRHERMDAWMFAGSIVIVLSVILVTGAKPRTQKPVPDLELPAVEGSGD